MENFTATFDSMVNELMNFAATWGIQEFPAVRFMLFQLRNPECEQLDNLFENWDTDEEETQKCHDNVQLQKEIDHCVKMLLFADEMDYLTNTCEEDGEWDLQIGSGDELEPGSSHRPEPQPGPSHQRDSNLQYTMRKKSEKTYAKNAAVDRTYQVKVDDQYRGQKLQDVRQGLHQMFDEVLDQARGDLAGNDLGRVVIHHEALNNPIIVRLQPWEQLNADAVMKTVEKVLNSNEDLAIDESFDISVGSIDLPKGGARRRITKLKGKNNSLQLKTSIVTIENEDQLCMARAIGVGWAKLNRCTPEEWKEMTKNRQKKSNLQLILENQKVPESYFKQLRNKKRGEQKQLAVTISQKAGVPLDRPASLHDLEAFEEVLGVRVMVVSAKLGNKFITSPSTGERPCIYLYMVDDDHFHAITSITGFFSAGYFCERCLKHYNNREEHECETHCMICKSNGCPKTDTPVNCQNCNMTCRSPDCYQRHVKVPVHKKGKDKGMPSGLSQYEKWWKCPTCYKVVNTEKRKKEDHQCGEHYCSSCQNFVLGDHLCYLRAIPAEEDFKPKFIFFDFECTQDEILECQEGYVATKKPVCEDCQPEKMCKSCTKCRHCKTSWCGKATHRPNFVVAHSVCPACIEKPLTPESVCRKCGTRCEECDNVDLFDDEDTGPCLGKCGLREVTFGGKTRRKGSASGYFPINTDILKPWLTT